jgi:hypothetical protein
MNEPEGQERLRADIERLGAELREQLEQKVAHLEAEIARLEAERDRFRAEIGELGDSLIAESFLDLSRILFDEESALTPDDLMRLLSAHRVENKGLIAGVALLHQKGATVEELTRLIAEGPDALREAIATTLKDAVEPFDAGDPSNDRPGDVHEDRT